MTSTNFFTDLEVHRNKGTTVEFYDEYAGQYDEIMKPTGYSILQEHAAKSLRDHINQEQSLILDVGCGTGMSGVYLEKAGFSIIHGTDPSTQSLKVASTKNVYAKLFEGRITDKIQLPCPENTYDGLACMGCVTTGYIEIRPAIQEFHRILKPGGFASFTITAHTIAPMERMEALGEAMSQNKMELLTLQKMNYVNEQKCYYCLMKKL